MALIAPITASAQIYSWRDEAGNLVLSDKKKVASAQSYSVSTGATFRTTKPVGGRAVRYQSLIDEHSTLNAVNADLVRAVIQAESAFNPRALSPKGAMGLMQLMPDTARFLGVQRPYDPEENIRGGTRYLRLLLDKYDDNVELALAAYNAGSGAVDKYGKRIPPYRETRDYVKKVGSASGDAPVSRRKFMIYKTIEIVEGRAVPRYSSEKPSSGTFQVVSR